MRRGMRAHAAAEDAASIARVAERLGIEPLDTSKLGPVRHDPNSEAARVQVVRDALDAIASDSPYLSEMWIAASAREYPHVLLKLARLLK